MCRSYNMIQPFILAIFLLLSTTTTEAVVAELSSPTFEMFVARFGKAYETMDDFMQRRRIFEKNVEEIVQLNKESSSVLHGINQFSDLTHSEFEARNLLDNDVLKKLLAQRNSLSLSTSFKALDATPGAHNWFSKATTPIRNQGQCGSCWAFSTVEQVESDWFLSGKSGWSKPIELSVQEVVDCDKTDAYACGGTYAGSGSGYDYITKNGGLASESSYPYTSGKTGHEGQCNKTASPVGGQIRNFSYAIKPCDLPWDDCTHQDEDALVQYVGTRGPLSICANARSWPAYKSGVLHDCGGFDHGSLDHCVQLVGYSGYDGKSAKTSGEAGAYWIVRNSWGTTWGDGGFIYLAMGNNTCGLADVPSFALV